MWICSKLLFICWILVASACVVAVGVSKLKPLACQHGTELFMCTLGLSRPSLGVSHSASTVFATEFDVPAKLLFQYSCIHVRFSSGRRSGILPHGTVRMKIWWERRKATWIYRPFPPRMKETKRLGYLFNYNENSGERKRCKRHFCRHFGNTYYRNVYKSVFYIVFFDVIFIIRLFCTSF